MRPVEAMKQAVARSRELGADGVYTDHEQAVEELCALGFAIVPIEPTDAIIEAMAVACVERAFDSPALSMGDAFAQGLRAAYAAAVKEAVGD